MSNNLQSFLLNTLQPELNNPKNSHFWLPNLLKSLKDSSGQAILPLLVSSIPTEELSGKNGSYIATTLAGDWISWNYPDYSGSAIPVPNKYPTLFLTNLNIQGLENVYLVNTTSTALENGTGYQSTGTIQFNYYSQLSTLTVEGDYTLQQDVCSSDQQTSTQCNGTYSDTVVGEGAFIASISQCSLLANFTVTIQGSGNNRSVSIQAQSLEIQGCNSQPPQIQFSKITVTNAQEPGEEAGIVSMAKQALQDPQACASIIHTVQQAINQSSTIQALGGLLAQAIGSAFDAVFSSVPSTGLPSDNVQQKALTAVDLYIFDRIRAAVNNAQSQWYLPQQVAISSNPIIDPYSISSLDIPDQSIQGLKYTDIALSQVTIVGTSNINIPNNTFILDESSVQALLVFGEVQEGPLVNFNRNSQSIKTNIPPAPPLNLSANFTFTQNGICPITVIGTATILIVNAQAALKVQPSGSDSSNLVFQVNTLTIDLCSAQITVQVKTNPDNSGLDQIAEKILQSSSAIEQITSLINSQLIGQLEQISSEFTTIARNTINNQLSN